MNFVLQSFGNKVFECDYSNLIALSAYQPFDLIMNQFTSMYPRLVSTMGLLWYDIRMGADPVWLVRL